MKSLKIATLAAASALLVIAASASAAAPIVDVVAGTTQVEWQPTGEFAGTTLRVSGPLGVTERVFAAGENPLFDLRTLDSVADGLYTWEIVATPRLDEGARRAMAAARASGDEGGLRSSMPEAEGFVQSGSFRVVDGAIVQPTGEPEAPSSVRRATAAASGDLKRATAADQVIPDDLIVQSSICVGFDCVNNENFGFDTVRLKENNTRIKFEDTSAGTFPSNDWQLTANDSSSGGSNKFSIEDITGAKVPFTLTAGAATNSIFVDSTGRVGFRTSTPVLDLHVATGNTPAIRLEQNNSSGFTAQTWDVAGNEANFFVRDVTSGSRLSFRIRPGAPTSSIDIAADGDVGIGTGSPEDKLHVTSTADPTNGQLFVENTSGTALLRTMINMQNNGGVRWQVNDRFQVRFNNNQFQFDNTTNAGNECVIDEVGNLTCLGAKNFATIDPVDRSRAIYYAALEGPEAGTYYRGRATTVDGEAVIELPEHFSKVTEIEGMTVHLTPIGAWAELYVAESTPERLVVRQSGDEAEDVTFSFLVQGVRMGYSDYQVVRSSASLLGDR